MKKGKVFKKWTEYKCQRCNIAIQGYINSPRKFCSPSCRSKSGNFGSLEKHANWKGDKVGYWGIHKWIIRHFGRPSTCQNCKKENLSGRKIHWANISHEYKRDINDWTRLCQSCHAFYDHGKITLNLE